MAATQGMARGCSARIVNASSRARRSPWSNGEVLSRMRARHYRSIRVSTPAHSSGSTCCSSNSHSSLAISRWLLMPNMITAFDSGNGALLDANRIDSVALVAACGLAAGTALPIPAVLFGPAIRTLRNGRVARTAVSSLLPGRESDFVLCPEGVYASCCRNLLAGRRLYRLYPWESLSLYEA